ncbi:MAG: hypothetical protein ACTSR8_03170 [Promethearchaeota archaeon]
MQFDSGLQVHKKKSHRPFISTGDLTLDELLGGGYHNDLVYLLYGDKKKTSEILITTAVIAQKSFNNGGLGDHNKVAFIDGNNRFNPYNVSKYAVSQNLSPSIVLENIIIARAFTWDQMVELLEHRLSKLDHVRVVLISGITSLFQTHKKKIFEDLLKAINGIKKMLEKTKPLIVITTPLNEFSQFRPKGGKILSHFGSVLVKINDDDRYVEYTLVQHPYLGEKRLLKWKPRGSKRKISNSSKNMTLDSWF